MKVKLVWITPNAEKMIVDMARVSSDPNKAPGPDDKLLAYLRKNEHWSPFEMASACFSIRTTRDIARQILRHRSFSFQEFSQRYAAVQDQEIEYRDLREPHPTNRQSSLPVENPSRVSKWTMMQDKVWRDCYAAYMDALEQGVAKEVARVLLPEGLAPSHMYMTGTLRSWIHYVSLRTGNGTQEEHRRIAEAIGQELHKLVPALFPDALPY